MGFSVVTVLDSESSTALRTQSASVVASSLTHPKQPATYQTHAGAPVKRKRNPIFGNRETALPKYGCENDRFRSIQRRPYLPRKKMLRNFVAFSF